MAASNSPGSTLDYLCVEPFLRGFTDVQALAAAFRFELFAELSADRQPTLEDLASSLGLDARGLQMLLDLLESNHVVESRNGRYSLTPAFSHALKFRDLFEAKIDFANLAAHDVVDFFPLLIESPNQFMAEARMFKLFAYNRCFEPTADNYRATKRWMRITTTLTKYEARACIDHHDFARVTRLLDIGGNSGEFVLQICRHFPDLKAAVFDLPLVCQIGREHLLYELEADRITFIPGSMLSDELPSGYDAISFKSMLHDWPDQEARHFLKKAIRALAPGGTVIIFERARLILKQGLPFGIMPFVTFAPCYREPEHYLAWLEEFGMRDLVAKRVDLEMPFFLISARKPA